MSILDGADMELIGIEMRLDDIATATVPFLRDNPRVMVAAQLAVSFRETNLTRNEMANSLAAAVLVIAERKQRERG